MASWGVGPSIVVNGKTAAIDTISRSWPTSQKPRYAVSSHLSQKSSFASEDRDQGLTHDFASKDPNKTDTTRFFVAMPCVFPVRDPNTSGVRLVAQDHRPQVVA